MNIYVGNLPIDTTEDELRQRFREFGEVLSVTIMNDKYIGSGQARGYGYVEMASKAEGITAIANLEGQKLRNRTISVVEALPLSNKDAQPAGAKKNHRSSRRRERKYQIY